MDAEGKEETKKAFEIDERLHIRLEASLALEISDIILASATQNRAVLAFGHSLRNSANVRRRRHGQPTDGT